MLPLISRFGAFVAERYPLAAPDALAAITAAFVETPPSDAAALTAARPVLRRELALRLDAHAIPDTLPETTPGVTAASRVAQARDEILEACDGFFHRASIEASLTRDERREMLRGMMLTRAVDTRLKVFFSSGEMRYEGVSFPGKGFRSLGQEAIYGAAIRLRRGPSYRRADGSWGGDVVAPVIRDLGVALAMRPDAATVRMALNSQMGKVGPPSGGKDLTIGDFESGILPPSAPLAIATATIAGMALSFSRQGEGRVALSFIGDGGSSLGEWHEAINLCAARRLPAIFCIENNQTALSTPISDQSAVRVFADKAAGYGIPGVTIDGTDVEAIAAAFAWAADRAREGKGPSLIELVSMRMCGHAHHDDMLYLGRDPQPSREYPAAAPSGYVDPERFAYWRDRDPIATYAARLEAAGVVSAREAAQFWDEVEALVEEEARALVDLPWPDPEDAGTGVLAAEPVRQRIDVLACADSREREWPMPRLDPGPAFDKRGRTYLEAISMAIGDALRSDPRVFLYGEDVGGQYGNAFLMFKPLLGEFGDRLVNSPIAESGIIGACVGAALAGDRPIGEIQFNDFVASGFNQLVNNAAKIRYRWGADVPMVLRLPFGGLRHAGPYHSQNTEAWFYRTPGLKIVVPSTPYDARSLMRAAIADPDPVLFYEHIALYRDPSIRQQIDDASGPVSIGRAALRRSGDRLGIVSYGAYVHVAMRVAGRLSKDGIEASVLDLRSLAPLDRDAVLGLACHCHRILIVHEDTRTGGIGESLAAIVQEEAFGWLDAPIRIVGALDTPVPYSPPLEARFLPGEEEIERVARTLAAY
ncbi:MAG: thiamine pyrophosphate-dependent enzyme [Vicinamibacterales bacterium]